MEQPAVTPKNTAPPALTANRRYIFGDFELLPADKFLFFQQTPVQTEPKIIDFLLILIEARPRLVSKEQLMSKLWPDTIVSDWSVARLVSDTRKLINDDGKTQAVIKTMRGKGYAFIAPVDEIIEAYPNAHRTHPFEDNLQEKPTRDDPNQTDERVDRSFKPAGYLLAGGFAIILLLMLGLFMFNNHEEKNTLATSMPEVINHSSKLHRTNVMLEIKKNLQLTKTAFISQAKRRNELGEIILAKYPELESQSWEQRLKQYYPHLTPHERFLFNQVKSLTQGPLYKGNSALLDLLHQHPEMYQEIDLLFALNSHLEIWMNKYKQVFLTNEDMPLVYVGVEDGVPFPSKIDGLVANWLTDNSTQENIKTAENEG